MRKNWISKRVHENAWGRHFTRWYIKSPSGNFYFIYRGCFSDAIYMRKDVNDHHTAQVLGDSWREAVQELYKLEESKLYPKSLSDTVESMRECELLYAS